MDPEEGVAGPHLAAKIIGAEETGGTGTEAPAVTTGEIPAAQGTHVQVK
jgi:hypothetical protein